jgi:hypothetical protein
LTAQHQKRTSYWLSQPQAGDGPECFNSRFATLSKNRGAIYLAKNAGKYSVVTTDDDTSVESSSIAQDIYENTQYCWSAAAIY